MESKELFFSTIGQDSHRFLDSTTTEGVGIILGGVSIPFEKKMDANSDGDVVLHAITNAISGFTCRNILGAIADELCLVQGNKDSSLYLRIALENLSKLNAKVAHVSISIACKRPKLSPYIEEMRLSLANLLGVDGNHIGITATTGEGLTSFGKGEGIQVLAILTICQIQ